MRLLHLSEQRRKEIASLARKKGRSLHRQMLVEGLRSVKSSLLAGAPLHEILVTEAILEDKEIEETIKATQSPVYAITEKAARQISSVETHQGIFAVAGIYTTPLEEFEKMAAVVALDGVQDPGNVGSIIRTAAWFGIAGILAGADTADFYNPKVIRASMGGIWDVKLARLPDLASGLLRLKKDGATMVAAELEGTPLSDWQPGKATVLVIGGEAHGISDAVNMTIDERVTIVGAMKKQGAESLNAGMAAGIIMHHWANSMARGRGGRRGGS